MSTRDRLLALLVAVIWGLNFPVTAIALDHFPPFLLVAVRFAILAIPTLLFVPRPKVPVRLLLAVGAGIGTAQFVFLYLAIEAGMPAGLASIVLQASAPFTVLIAAIVLGERIPRARAVGIAVAVAGLAVIAFHRAQAAAFLPVALTLLAALGWALGNVATRKAAAPNPLHLTLWTAVVPPVPAFALSWTLEGPDAIGATLGTVFTLDALPSVLSVLYLVVMATCVGYGIWNTLLRRYPSSTVAPFSMLVPVIGVLSSWAAFGETVDAVELAGGALVVGGVLASSVQWKRRRGVLREPAGAPGA